MARTSAPPPRFVARWNLAVFAIFVLMGFSFGGWLSRLPAVRDHLGASTLEMSVFGLVLALGSVSGLVLSGRTVSALGPRRAMTICVAVQVVAMPAAASLLWADQRVAGAALLAVYGFCFSTTDVAMNVSGAGSERALGKPRMPAYHGAYSLGAVSATALGALLESAAVPVPAHFVGQYAAIAVCSFLALRGIPRVEPAHEEEPELPTPSVHTGPIEIVPGAAAPDPAPAAPPRYTPWTQPRILVIGLIAMSASLAEGTASDWLPLALADGRGFANDAATLTLGVCFATMTLVRFAGAPLLTRFGRVAVLRASAALLALGVATVILVPFAWASVAGAILWGLGASFGFPIGISAAADRPRTAVRDVAAVSAIAYTAFLLGPMLIGFLGEHLGLLQAFWPIVAAAGFVVVAASAARERT